MEMTNEDNLHLDKVELNSMSIQVEDGDSPAGVTSGSGNMPANNDSSIPGNNNGGMLGNDNGSMPGNNDGGTLGNTGSGCNVAGSTGSCYYMGNANNDCNAAGNSGNIAVLDNYNTNYNGCKSCPKWLL